MALALAEQAGLEPQLALKLGPFSCFCLCVERGSLDAGAQLALAQVRGEVGGQRRSKGSLGSDLEEGYDYWPPAPVQDYASDEPLLEAGCCSQFPGHGIYENGAMDFKENGKDKRILAKDEYVNVMALCTFAIPVKDVSGRLGLLSGCFLAVLAYRYIVNEILPRKSYLTAADMYISFACLFQIGICAQTVVFGILRPGA
ncbi:unnamed protein product [Effrenium voratum]|nr:unnamed protein product [Effrenium voratum]